MDVPVIIHWLQIQFKTVGSTGYLKPDDEVELVREEWAEDLEQSVQKDLKGDTLMGLEKLKSHGGPFMSW